MPGGDRTGREGRGPLTGRRLGYCSGNDNAGFFFPGGFGRGRGRGSGRGIGRGFGRGYRYEDPVEDIPPVDRSRSPQSDEVQELKDRIRSLEEELERAKDKLKKP
jgi:hypothetical protein